MPTVAYLANQLPSPLEPYVIDEIVQLRRSAVEIVPCSVWRPSPNPDPRQPLLPHETLYLLSSKWKVWLYGTWLALRHILMLRDFISRALFRGNESVWRRLKALGHTVLGAYYAQLLTGRGVQHIHVHHGYFAAWIAMVAARLLRISFSMTLHGSDLLIHDAYLDMKLGQCSTCFTISDYNRRYILGRYPDIPPGKILVQRLGVVPSTQACSPSRADDPTACFVMLSVARLHPVKNHAFLVDTCSLLKKRGRNFICLVAGEGPERASLQCRIERLGLEHEVRLLGHVIHDKLQGLYAMADLVVLTSHSEGIPLSLMEAMSWERLVLAPAITGIPELVIDGKTGFLYEAGSLSAFVEKVERIYDSLVQLSSVRTSARKHVMNHFNQAANLESFTALLLSQLSPSPQSSHAHPVLQQI
jgi:colanic acid/amylovoran biosynthesis glycosyltransferase